MAAGDKLGEIVFAHDYPFLHVPEGRVYSDRGDWPWHQYLAFSDRVKVASRARALSSDEGVGELTLVSQPGVSYVAIPSLSGPRVRFANRRQARRRLRAAIADADALVARLPSEIGSLAADVADDLGKPWAVEVVTCTWDALWNYGTWQGKVYAPVSWWKTRRVVRRAPFALYVTERFLQRRYPSRGRSVGCSDVELPEPDPAVLERRLERIGSSPGPVRIGVIAALTVKFKGVQTALAALGRVKAELPPFEFHVLGAGDSEPWRRLARTHGVEEQTHFAGTVPPDAVPLWLDALDLYIQPSYQEGLPRSLIEALNRACPALGSTAGGIPELLEPDCLHRPGDEQRLGELLVSAAADRDWQAAQATRNVEVARRYSKPELERIRTGFWREFAESARA